MKIKGLVRATVLSLSFLITAAQGETQVFSRLSTSADLCGQIPGHWQGSGTVKKSVITCNYSGEGDVTLTGPGQFMMTIALRKTSGVCPSGETFSFTGTCSGSQIHLQTPDADLRGDLAGEVNSLAVNNINGKVWLSVVGVRTSVDVEMAIHKTN